MIDIDWMQLLEPKNNSDVSKKTILDNNLVNVDSPHNDASSLQAKSEISLIEISTLELRLLGYYNLKNQNMYPEVFYVEKATQLAELLQKSFINILKSDIQGRQLANVYNEAVFIFRDRAANLFAFFPKKGIARISDVRMNKKLLTKVNHCYKHWFVVGTDFFQFVKEKKIDSRKYITKVSSQDLDNSISDKYGVLFNRDRTRLLKAPQNLYEYEVPESVNTICEDAFCGCQLSNIILHSTLECIGRQAFKGCKNLSKILLPEGLIRIDQYAFWQCCLLKEIVIPSTVRDICICDSGEVEDFRITPYVEGALNVKIISKSENFKIKGNAIVKREGSKISRYIGCDEIYETPPGVTEIGWHAFDRAMTIKTLIFTDVNYIGDDAFYYSENIQNVYMSDNVKGFGQYAFCGCHKLCRIRLSNSITEISSDAFSECIKLRSVIIPDSVTSIHRDAFKNCYSLIEIKLPETLLRISEMAFQSCTSLKQVMFPKALKIIESRAFRYCKNLFEIWVCNDNISIGDRAFLGTHISIVHIIKGGNKIRWKSIFPSARIIEDII